MGTEGSSRSSSDRRWIRHRRLQVPDTARSMRLELRRELREAGVDGQVLVDAELVLGELVANAVQHGRADADGLIEVSWCLLEDRVLLSVQDSGHVHELVPGDLRTQNDSGRGLALVAQMSNRWCWSAESGTQVDAELLLP